MNRADLMQRQGFYPPPPGAPPYPGLECAGQITAVGDGVTGLRPGDEVCALLAGGGYAEQVAVPAVQVLPVPAGLTVAEAAALPEVACTVYANVFIAAGLKPGETLLVHGGASGIGTMAIQLGPRPRRQGGLHRGLGQPSCAAAGSSAPSSPSTTASEDFVAAVRDFTGGSGADVILDIMGGAYLERNVAALAIGGRLVVIGMQGGATAELDLGTMLQRGHRARRLAAGPARRGEGRHGRRRARRASGRSSCRARSSPSSTPSSRWRKRPERTS